MELRVYRLSQELQDSKAPGDEETKELMLARETMALAKEGDTEHSKLYLYQ